jgi:hypothetical protein
MPLHRLSVYWLGPENDEGDIICVLAGGRVPFVLRSCKGPVLTEFNTNDSFTLIGECYVHNIMDGQINGPSKRGRFYQLRDMVAVIRIRQSFSNSICIPWSIADLSHFLALVRG